MPRARLYPRIALATLRAVTLEAQLQQLVNQFVAEVARIARQAAMDTLAGTLIPAAGAVAAPGPRRSMGAAAAPSARRPKGAKRAAGDIESLQQRLLDHIRSNPGQRVEQINAALSTRTPDVRLPLAKLIASGDLRTTGQKRSTQYFAS